MQIATNPPAEQTVIPKMYDYVGWLVALIPLALLIFFATLVEPVLTEGPVTVSYAWVPSLDVNLSFYVDGLSLIFALLISGIGALVMVYAGGYLHGHPMLGRFYAYLLLFMTAMLGVVLANNIITLFVFWELTSLSSYLLIGFNHREQNSRDSALQALLITGLGGLALLAGLILLGVIGGSWELSTLLGQGELLRAHPLYVPMIVLILLGAFTKSAQFPFHVWLPNAMAAPTPVSSYLHSATMVKAGVYLVARMNPTLGGTEVWQFTLVGFGGLTMLMGAYIAWQQTDLKKVLAYSTVSALGTLMFLIGVGTPVAVKAAIVFLIVHSLYKGALFMAAGAIDHETGTRDLSRLSGLRKAMPITFVAVGLASLSMAGALPFFVGYIGKKLIYEATLTAATAGWWLTGVAIAANILTVVVAGMLAHRPFFGKEGDMPKHPHEAPISLWLGPIVLSVLGLVLVVLIEFVPASYFLPLLVSSATSVFVGDLVEVKLAAWSGFNLVFFLSLFTVVGGIAMYTVQRPLQRAVDAANAISALGPQRLYEHALVGLKSFAAWQTNILQHGYLRYYLLIILLSTVGLAGYVLLSTYGLNIVSAWEPLRFHEVLIALIMIIATVTATISTSRLTTVVAVGVVGYGLSVFFVLFGAPDLAMTQLAVETLTVIILVLVLFHLPSFSQYSSKATRLRDAGIALVVGTTVTLLVLTMLALPTTSLLSPYFAENSVALAQGRNIVNVILVDFRAIDTLGEITVLAVAAIGIYALLTQRKNQTKDHPVDETANETATKRIDQ